MHFIWQVEKSRNTELEKHYWVIFSATVWLGLSLSALCMIFLIQLKCSTCIWDCCWHRNLLLSISLKGCFCHLQKCVFYLKSLNGTSLVKHHVVVFLCPGLTFGSWYCTISFLIEFVSDTYEIDSKKELFIKICNFYTDFLKTLYEYNDSIEWNKPK